MKKIVSFHILLFVLFAIISYCQTQDIDELFKNKLLVQREIACVMDRGVCDIIGNSLKAALIEVLRNDCRHCSPQQAYNALKIVQFMETYHPAEWNDIILKYQQDP